MQSVIQAGSNGTITIHNAVREKSIANIRPKLLSQTRFSCRRRTKDDGGNQYKKLVVIQKVAVVEISGAIIFFLPNVSVEV